MEIRNGQDYALAAWVRRPGTIYYWPREEGDYYPVRVIDQDEDRVLVKDLDKDQAMRALATWTDILMGVERRYYWGNRFDQKVVNKHGHYWVPKSRIAAPLDLLPKFVKGVQIAWAIEIKRRPQPIRMGRRWARRKWRGLSGPGAGPWDEASKENRIEANRRDRHNSKMQVRKNMRNHGN